MNIDSIAADSVHSLLHEDGRVTVIDSLAAGLVVAIKQHGHYGNIAHHVSGGDWPAMSAAWRELLVMPSEHHGLSRLARNLVTMLDEQQPANLCLFRRWLFDHVERLTTNLYRRSLERRLDAISDQIHTADFVFRKSALRILAEAH